MVSNYEASCSKAPAGSGQRCGPSVSASFFYFLRTGQDNAARKFKLEALSSMSSSSRSHFISPSNIDRVTVTRDAIARSIVHFILFLLGVSGSRGLLVLEWRSAYISNCAIHHLSAWGECVY